MSEDLRQKIIDIICKEWPTPDGYLLWAPKSTSASEGRASTSPTTPSTTSWQSSGVARADNPYVCAARGHSWLGPRRRRRDHP